MIMRLFVGAMVILGLVFFCTPVNAEECETPQMSVTELNEVAKKHNAENEIVHFVGDDAQKVREFIIQEFNLPSEAILEFDEFMMAKGTNGTSAKMWSGVYKDGCLIYEEISSVEFFDKVETFVKGFGI